ncbi:MAG: tryptophan synthase subunit alpha [Candidatus Methylopumilus sp.]|nr:tryptophan synthase subunit alpha [Candidatus Methylopumilus sp.]
MSRITNIFKALKEKNKKALIPYITAGDPHPDLTVSMMHALVEAGADMIELGIPFSDPMADGPIIQRASERALAHHVSLSHVFKMVKIFREKDAQTPIILMGYANPIEAIGAEAFVERAKASDVDGIITVDYPPEECMQFTSLLKEKNINSIFLLSPTTELDRVKLIIEQTSGFLYYVSLKGVTGAANIDIEQVKSRVAMIRKLTNLPIGVGFGVKDAATAKEVAKISDAIVVGSRIVQEIENSNKDNLIINISKLMKELRQAVN